MDLLISKFARKRKSVTRKITVKANVNITIKFCRFVSVPRLNLVRSESVLYNSISLWSHHSFLSTGFCITTFFIRSFLFFLCLIYFVFCLKLHDSEQSVKLLAIIIVCKILRNTRKTRFH